MSCSAIILVAALLWAVFGMGIGWRLALYEQDLRRRDFERHHNKFRLPGAKPVRCEWRIVPVSDD